MLMRKERVTQLSFWVLLAVAAAVFAYLGFTTTWEMDDYWYVCFWKDGPLEFLKLNQYHYLNFNGRVLVHLFVQTILALGNWAIGLVFPIITLAIPFFAVKAERNQQSSFAVAAVFFSALLLALSRNFFVEAYNWVSAFGNFVLPTAMLSLQIYLLARLKTGHTRRSTVILAWVWCLLCGATTEQSGLAALAVSACFVLWSLLHQCKLAKSLLICAVLNLGGLISVFLSPATRERTQVELRGSVIDSFLHGLRAEGAIFFEHILTCVWIGFVFLALAGFSHRILHQSKAGLCWLITGCLVPFLPLLPGEWRAFAMFLLLAAIGFAALHLFFFSPHVGLGSLFLCAFVTQAAVLMTNSIGARTVLPGLLYLFAAFGIMMGTTMKCFPLTQVALCILLMIPGGILRGAEFPGYWKNYLIEQENLGYIDEFQTTHRLRYNMDYIGDLCYAKVDDTAFFQRYYCYYAGLDDPDGKIYFFSDSGYTIYSGGEQTSVPAFRQDGILYLPVRCLEGMGGSVFWTSEVTNLDLGGIHAEIVGSDAFVYTDQNGAEQSVPMVKVEACTSSLFLPEWVYRDVFGLAVMIDEEERRITIRL